jgi:hypothetical protein
MLDDSDFGTFSKFASSIVEAILVEEKTMSNQQPEGAR